MTMGPYIYPNYPTLYGHSCNCQNCPGRNRWFDIYTTTIPSAGQMTYYPKHRKPGPAR